MRDGLLRGEEGGRLPGPGSVRVARWVGRLGVVSLPAVQIGLDLDQRVVRRHAARLEEAGWLDRAAGVWGQGSVVWLTPRGLQAVGLGGVPAVRADPEPSPSLTAHGVQVAWSAARIERRGLVWRSARELAADRERWGILARSERGWRTVLPDLAVWLRAGGPPAAIVVEAGYRREDRQRMILEAWRTAIHSGRYAGVRYDCAGEPTVRQIARLAEKAAGAFLAVAQMTGEQIAAIKPTPPVDELVDGPASVPGVDRQEPERDEEDQPVGSAPAAVEPSPIVSPPAETPEAAAERERRYREIMGYPEPKRRRWHRR